MISLFRRGRIYWVRGSFQGERIRPRSMDTSDRVVGERRKRDLELALEQGRIDGRWDDLMADFMRSNFDWAVNTRKKYRFVVHRFGEFLRAQCIQRLSAIDSATISNYIESRQQDVHPTKKRAMGPEGIKSDLRILRAVFSWAVGRERMTLNPVSIPNLNARVRNTQPFHRAEIEAMLVDATPATGSPDIKAIVLTFLTTGLRISDVTGLGKASIDWTHGRIVHRIQKLDKEISLSIHPSLQVELLKVEGWHNAAQRSSPWVFSTKTGKRLRNLDGMLRKLWRRCKIDGGHAHRFRDTFSVGLLQQGASLYDVAQLLGITESVCARHYAPYVRELQERGHKFVMGLNYIEHNTAGVQ